MQLDAVWCCKPTLCRQKQHASAAAAEFPSRASPEGGYQISDSTWVSASCCCCCCSLSVDTESPPPALPPPAAGEEGEEGAGAPDTPATCNTGSCACKRLTASGRCSSGSTRRHSGDTLRPGARGTWSSAAGGGGVAEGWRLGVRFQDAMRGCCYCIAVHHTLRAYTCKARGPYGGASIQVLCQWAMAGSLLAAQPDSWLCFQQL